MKSIGILTTFHDWSEAYSLAGVVKHQLLALLKHGYEPVLFVLEIFPEDKIKDIPEGTEVRRVIPQIILEPYKGIASSHQVPPQFEKDVAKLLPVFQKEFNDIDMMLCHDIIFQDSFLSHNATLRKMTMPKGQKFFHWMHSGPSHRPANPEPPISYLYTLPPQSTLIYMNNYDIVRAAEMYGVYPSDVRIVHNPIDYRTLPHIHPVVKQVVEDFKLHEADIIATYPLSTTRMGGGGKQIQKAIMIMGHLKKLGNEVRLIVPNAHANAANEKSAIGDVLEFCKSRGLGEKDVIFTSLINPPEYEHGISHDAVLQFFQMSDIFLFPSFSENCPLILLEAALTKNLLILNEDFSPMKDFVGPHALYFKFDSVMTTTNHPRGEDVYYEDVAKIILAELKKSRSYQSARVIRQKFNMDYVFKNELELLFYSEEKKEKHQVSEVPELKPGGVIPVDDVYNSLNDITKRVFSGIKDDKK